MNIKRSFTVNAPIDQVWHVLINEFDQIGEWATAVPQSGPNPDLAEGEIGRVCVTDYGPIKENITHYDPQNYSYTYVAHDLPFFVRSAQNSWTLKPLGGNQTAVTFHAVLNLLPVIGWVLGYILVRQLNKTSQELMEELEYYIQHGRPHPRKQSQLEGQLKTA